MPSIYPRLAASRPFFLFAGPNVIESKDHCLRMAHAIAEAAARFNLVYVFKSSFDKANRTSLSSFRGPGLEEGLKILDAVKRQVGVPIITDIHEPARRRRWPRWRTSANSGLYAARRI